MASATSSIKRNILLVALGTTPRLTTVTLCAIHKTYPNEMPTEIHVVTTKKGAEMAVENYLSPEKRFLDRFYKDYGLVAAEFGEKNIHVIPGERGVPLEDIRTQADSERAADYIVKLIRTFCADPESRLHVSIVGGRKSMGMLLGSAMTFYGRDQDRISHVLSSETQEAAKEPYPSLETLKANPDLISLGEIPFLRLRPILPAALLNEEYSYHEIVEHSQEELGDTSKLEIVKPGKKYVLRCEDIDVQPEAAHMGLYVWLAIRQFFGKGATEISYGRVPLETYFALRYQYLKVAEIMQSHTQWEKAFKTYLGLSVARMEKLEKELSGEYFSSFKDYYWALVSRLNEEEKKSLSAAAKIFSKKLSTSRTRVNESLKEILSKKIPDVTNRRWKTYLVNSVVDGSDSTKYCIGVPKEHLFIAKKFINLFVDDSVSVANEWKRV